MTWPSRMITAPTGTSPTSQAFCAWSSAMRIAYSSAGVTTSSPTSFGGAIKRLPRIRLRRSAGGAPPLRGSAEGASGVGHLSGLLLRRPLLALLERVDHTGADRL